MVSQGAIGAQILRYLIYGLKRNRSSAGALMLTPGFITDTVGFLFLASPLRRALADKIVNIGFFTTLGMRESNAFDTRAGREGGRASDIIIDGEYVPGSVHPSDSALVDDKRDAR